MMVNWQDKEIILKIVYYGPALSGKTTNLEKIHENVSPDHRSELVSLKNKEDRTLFFDFVQIDLAQIKGFTPRINLYTVPGQSYYKISRKLVLTGADGVVFVADSAHDRMAANIEAWADMAENMSVYDMSADARHVVIQCNKQDLPKPMTIQEIQRSLNPGNIPLYPAVALKGEGVFETFKAITSVVFSNIAHEFATA